MTYLLIHGMSLATQLSPSSHTGKSVSFLLLNYAFLTAIICNSIICGGFGSL